MPKSSKPKRMTLESLKGFPAPSSARGERSEPTTTGRTPQHAVVRPKKEAEGRLMTRQPAGVAPTTEGRTLENPSSFPAPSSARGERSEPTTGGRTIEDLAAITSRGFELIEGRLDSLEKKTDSGFAHINARLDQVRRDIASIDDLNKRVRHLEKLMRVAR